MIKRQLANSADAGDLQSHRMIELLRIAAHIRAWIAARIASLPLQRRPVGITGKSPVG